MTFSIRNLSSEFLIHFFSNSKLSWEPHYKIQPSHQEKAWIWPRVFKSKQTNCVLFLPLVTAPLDAMPSFSNLSNFFSSEGSKALELILTMPSDNVILSWTSSYFFFRFSCTIGSCLASGSRSCWSRRAPSCQCCTPHHATHRSRTGIGSGDWRQWSPLRVRRRQSWMKNLGDK